MVVYHSQNKAEISDDDMDKLRFVKPVFFCHRRETEKERIRRLPPFLSVTLIVLFFAGPVEN